MLQAIGLTKRFGGLTAVNDVNLSVKSGTIHALLGPNGAGKTTCFNLLTKFSQPSHGTILFRGKDITALTPISVARMGIGRSFQISSVFLQMTALENVRVALQRRRGESYDFWRSRRVLDALNEEAMALLERVDLQDFADKTASEMSYGRKRALEIATTLALAPQLLLLDEPMAGMAVADIGMVSDLIRKLGENHTILMVEHNLRVVSDLCHVITVLARGRVLAEGTYREVSANEEVQRAYMGTGHAHA